MERTWQPGRKFRGVGVVKICFGSVGINSGEAKGKEDGTWKLVIKNTLIILALGVEGFGLLDFLEKGLAKKLNSVDVG